MPVRSDVRGRARALAAWFRGTGPLRLLARARRHPNVLLAALLGAGILWMVVHWSGSMPPPPALRAHHAEPRSAAAPPQPAPPPAHGGGG